MPPSLSLRRATPGDIGAIMRVERRPAHDMYVGRSESAEHARWIASPDCAVFVGCDGVGAVRVFAVITEWASLHGDLYLKRLAVDAPGQGLGSDFLGAALTQAFAQPVAHRISLTVFAHNLRAQRLYEKFGFRREGLKREAVLRADGVRCDVVCYGLLRAEWPPLGNRLD